MIQPQLKQMMEKLDHFSPERLAEVENFIDFLQQRDQDRLLRQDYAYAQEASFAKVWDNDEDAIYDKLYNFGDVVLVSFPFTNLQTAKKRPAVVSKPKDVPAEPAGRDFDGGHQPDQAATCHRRGHAERLAGGWTG
uniref:DUF2281 domain-containing protein n=1 Tax=Candidatus Kentrum sp. TC TaxID=2126339 RepID=A0A450ZD76_9GAMM|nr:MAG: hypothetical protein BECKTC1821D_GA0114238_11386 [Candidatus Kentron sp. TC]